MTTWTGIGGDSTSMGKGRRRGDGGVVTEQENPARSGGIIEYRENDTLFEAPEKKSVRMGIYDLSRLKWHRPIENARQYIQG